MGVNRRAPWWLTWLLAGGLLSIFVGERILGTAGLPRLVLSLGGAAAVIACVVWRGLSWRSATDEGKSVERLLFLAHLGCVVALVGYFVSSVDGMRLLRIEFMDPRDRMRYTAIMQVLWSILLASSLLPALAAQLGIAAHRHSPTGASGVEAFRIRETAAAGLTVAFAGALLFLVVFIASDNDKTLDLSYFKTATPGTATENIVASFEEPLRVLLFFPTVNPVKDEVMRYFRQLQNRTGRVQIEEYDRLASPMVAGEFSVIEDGTIVVARGDQSERISIGAEMNTARSQLRTLDRLVQTALMPMIRERRRVYLTTGHGEINDPQTAHYFNDVPLGRVETLREILNYLNYDVADIGVASGLAFDVPSDAAMLLIIGPRRPFIDAEIAAIERYLERGGSILLALDPGTEFQMGGLADRLGVRFTDEPLVDDQQYVRQRGDVSDRRLLVTDRFLSHEIMTTINRAAPGSGILAVGPGRLEEVEGGGGKPIFIVRSASSSFADLDRDFEYDDGTETRSTYNIVAAIDGLTPSGSAGEDASAERGEGRALVFASSAMLSDAVITSLGLNAALVANGVRWLGGEEKYAGTTESEEDVPIVHTRDEDVAWFYATILGAPALVLGAGLAGVYRHRRRRREA